MNKYMKVAKDLADFNLETNNGGPFGACVVKDDKIIGKVQIVFYVIMILLLMLKLWQFVMHVEILEHMI